MTEISGFIREGAFAFLKREYKSMAIVIVVLFIVIGIALDFTTAVLYLFGALLSVLAGFFGMNVATKGNVRTAAAAKDSGMNKALKVAFRSGAVMGLCVSGLGLLGVGIVVTCLDLATVTQCITGFGFGASSMARSSASSDSSSGASAASSSSFRSGNASSAGASAAGAGISAAASFTMAQLPSSQLSVRKAGRGASVYLWSLFAE